MTHSIISERLILRSPTLEDAEELFANYTSDPAVTAYVTWIPHGSPKETKAFLEMCLQKWQDGSEYNFVIQVKETQKLIGMFKIKIDAEIAEIGYVFSQSEWNKGYATEATKAALKYLFADTKVTSVQAFCDKENTASEKVMLKVGMTFVKLLPKFVIHPNVSSEKRDCLLYEIKKESFRDLSTH